MSRTRRIYNRYIRKSQRYSAEDFPEREGYKIIIGNIIGIPYHPYHQLCMGRCRFCRDPDLDPRHQRKIRSRELKQMLQKEMV